MKNLVGAFLLGLFMSSFGNAQDIQGPRFGKGILNISGKDSTWSMNFTTRFQLLGSGTWQENQDGGTDFNSNFLVRRARLKFEGFAFTKNLTYKLEIGLANQDIDGASYYTDYADKIIQDAYIQWKFYKNLSIKAGQAKLPGNIERLISSGSLQFVDRSLLNKEFNIDRDIGLQLLNEHYLTPTFLIREQLAFSQGDGRNVTVGNMGGYQYTGRIELLPLGIFKNDNEMEGSALEREDKPRLMIAVAYDYNDDAVNTQSNRGDFMGIEENLYQTDITTMFADVVFKYKGVSLLAEYANRSAEDAIAKDDQGIPTGDVVRTGNAFNIQGGYLFDSNWELSGRYTHVDLDQEVRSIMEENQYTLGVSKYIVGHNLKLQTDISYATFADQSDMVMARLQLEIQF
ncbi:phosphate-selective porin O and P [Galbibacter marinus]|uniref:Phosphate-selective porin O and P n=1 Tax=Galbibacter marinus TaxID=555500 RepID=K2Q6Y8_9FLAO|nr:porin [Galbibacter marinus]EKF56646.1 phosphate-selective porin O and P [Galbibacter marinus]